MFANTCLQLTHLRCTFCTPDADVHSAAVGFYSGSSRPLGAMLFVSTNFFQWLYFTASQVPGPFTKHIYLCLNRAGLWMSFYLPVFTLASGKGFFSFFFFLNKNKFRWQWINYTVTNTELIHFPPRRLQHLLTPGWRCSMLTALEGKFQSIPFHLIPVEFFPWPQHDRFSDGNLFFYTSLQPYCGVLPTAPSSDNTSTTAPWGKNTEILCKFF